MIPTSPATPSLSVGIPSSPPASAHTPTGSILFDAASTSSRMMEVFRLRVVSDAMEFGAGPLISPMPLAFTTSHAEGLAAPIASGGAGTAALAKPPLSTPEDIISFRKFTQGQLLEARSRLSHQIATNPIFTSMRKISALQLYKLFIDAERWPTTITSTESGLAEEELTFDKREPGYMAAMMNAFIEVMNVANPLTTEALIRIHDVAVETVASVREGRGEYFRTGLRPAGKEQHVSFYLEVGKTLSLAGYNELLAKTSSPSYNVVYSEEEENIFSVFIEKPDKTIGKAFGTEPTRPQLISIGPRTAAMLPISINKIVEHFSRSISLAQSEDARLHAIIRLVQDLDQLHPFHDGNIRTFALLLLQRLLIDNGFSPTCMLDPNCFDCLSIDELVLAVREGQRKFSELCDS